MSKSVKMAGSVAKRLTAGLVSLAVVATLLISVGGSSPAAAEVRPPNLLEAMRGPEGVRLGWEPVAGAAGYNIYRGPVGGEISYLTTINDQNTTSFHDHEPVSHSSAYYLTAFDSNDQHSQKSRVVPAAARTMPAATGDPFGQPCETLASYVTGCRSSGGQWTPAFTEFARLVGIPAGTDIGARVQFLPDVGASDPLERVVYVVGPYFPEGREPGDATVNGEWRDTTNEAPVLNQLRTAWGQRDVSVVYIGFGDLDDSQQSTSQRVVATKDAIRSFELLRAQAAVGRGSAPSALLGVSLGGVVGKIAVRELEDEGFNHSIHTYMSFDSPHWGAYTPIGLQRLPLFVAGGADWMDDDVGWVGELLDDLDWTQYRVGEIEDLANGVTLRTLRSPVAQDMMIFNLAYPDDRSPNIDYIRSRYRSLPRQTSRNVAIASGATNGNRPQLTDYYFRLATGDAGRNQLKSRITVDVRVPDVDQNQAFSGELSFLAPFNGFKINDRVKRPRTHNVTPIVVENFERAPCAHDTRLVTETTTLLTENLAQVWSGVSIEPDETDACFIPSFSAVIGSTNNHTVTAFDEVIGDGVNKQHMETSAPMDRRIVGIFNNLFPTVIRPVRVPVVNVPRPGDQHGNNESTSNSGPSSSDESSSSGSTSSGSTSSPRPDGPSDDSSVSEPQPQPQPEPEPEPQPQPEPEDGPPPPTNFTVTAYSSSAIGVDWNKVDGATRYVLTRDGAVLYDSNGNGYWDDGLERGRTYTYTLVAYHGNERSSILTIDRATNS